MSDCGASSESCCVSLEVTGGVFYRTYNNSGNGPTNEADPATVSSFRLDKYVVTVGRFRRFADAWDAGYRPPAGSGKHTHLNGGQGLANAGADANLAYEPGWVVADESDVTPMDTVAQMWTWPPPWFGPLTPALEHMPMNSVNWYESYAFCIWDRGFLPSEAEYEYAAAGGNQQREYPWGTTAPGTSNAYAIYNCNYPNGGDGRCTNTAQNLAPVGTATQGAGLWGHLDLVGDVLEWNLDWYASSYVNPCSDCAYLVAKSQKAFRGTTCAAPIWSLLPTDRGGSMPTWRDGTLGFRCARSP
jgi:sulfatase modifying factor 1